MSRCRQALLLLPCLAVLAAPATAHADHVSTNDLCYPYALLVPAYSYPEPGSPYWRALTEAARSVELAAIVNPNNGPGESVDPSYATVIDSLRGAGGRAIGYVYTEYGARPLATVLADVDSFASFYPIDGIFVDEMSTDTSPAVLAYYTALHDHVKTLDPGYWVVGNPGTETDEAYLSVADALVTFEDSAGHAEADPPAWVYGYSPDRFADLVHSVPTADSMRTILGRALDRNSQWVYVTDDQFYKNPWDELPTYWEEEVAAVRCSAVPDPRMPSRGVALRAHPTPTFPGQVVSIALKAGDETNVWITDIQGRRVSHLGPRLSAGSHELRWDGTDDHGRRVPPGMYLVVAHSARAQRAARVLLLH